MSGSKRTFGAMIVVTGGARRETGIREPTLNTLGVSPKALGEYFEMKDSE